jgi:hypothetical protein
MPMQGDWAERWLPEASSGSEAMLPGPGASGAVQQ